MQKKLLRSVLAAAFSAVMAFGALSGLSEAKGDVRADSAWRVAAQSEPQPEDSAWRTEDSAWAVES
ncbi:MULTISPECIES: hypothetical protein [unclassified Streptomyces]|uniref:hypothetical protein n=1 Tax=unclassified Streptomyces TaxID=2593676 RepID=UPI0022536A89|nr:MULTISPECIES: hypothetical protein [unclassified Streptomyces]MCX5332631.1 hypothetical protein [Streptomyces sp. NBC_00140]MCX5362029.1 hypothetical protein [Streptomyces sp. NBC_00124]